jgi:hypothetical protein
MTTTDLQEQTCRLRNAVEPVAAGVVFAPESHAAYEALGFDGSPTHQGGVDRPNMTAYFTSRGACMGQVTGAVVAAAFGCFNPVVVVPAVEEAMRLAIAGESFTHAVGEFRQLADGRGDLLAQEAGVLIGAWSVHPRHGHRSSCPSCRFARRRRPRCVGQVGRRGPTAAGSADAQCVSQHRAMPMSGYWTCDRGPRLRSGVVRSGDDLRARRL